MQWVFWGHGVGGSFAPMLASGSVRRQGGVELCVLSFTSQSSTKWFEARLMIIHNLTSQALEFQGLEPALGGPRAGHNNLIRDSVSRIPGLSSTS